MYHALVSIVLTLLVGAGILSLYLFLPEGILDTAVEPYQFDGDEWETEEIADLAQASRRNPKPRAQAWLRKHREHQPNSFGRRPRLRAKLFAGGRAIPDDIFVLYDIEEDIEKDVALQAGDILTAQEALVGPPATTTVYVDYTFSLTTHQLKNDIEHSVEPQNVESQADTQHNCETQVDIEDRIKSRVDDALSTAQMRDMIHSDDEVSVEEKQVLVEEDESFVGEDSFTFVVEESIDDEGVDNITASGDIAEELTKLAKSIEADVPEVSEVYKETFGDDNVLSDEELLAELLAIIDDNHEPVVETPDVQKHPKQITSRFLGHLKESIASDMPYLCVLDPVSPPKSNASEFPRLSGVNPTEDLDLPRQGDQSSAWTPVAHRRQKSRFSLQEPFTTDTPVVLRTTKWRRVPPQQGWVVHSVEETSPAKVDQDVATEAGPQDASVAPDDTDVPKKKTRRAGAKARRRCAARALREAAEQEAAGTPLDVNFDGSVKEPSEVDLWPKVLPSALIAGPSSQVALAHQFQDKVISEPSGETRATKKKKSKRAGNTVRVARRRRGDAEREEQAIQRAADHEVARIYLATYANIPGNVTIVESGPWRIPTTAPETFHPVYPAYIGAEFPPPSLGTTLARRTASVGSGLLTIGYVARPLVGTELEEFLQAANTPRPWATGIAVTRSYSRVSEDSRRAAEVVDVDSDFFPTEEPRPSLSVGVNKAVDAAPASHYIPVNVSDEGPTEYNPPRDAKYPLFPLVNAAFMAAGHPDFSPPCRLSLVDDSSTSFVLEDSPCASTTPVPQDVTRDAPSSSVAHDSPSDTTVPVPESHAMTTPHIPTTVVTISTLTTATTPTSTATATQSTSGSTSRRTRVILPRGLHGYLGRAATPAL